VKKTAKPQLSYREEQLARKVAWAKREGLHEAAVRYAGKYLNLDEPMLRHISAYETAASMPESTSVERAERNDAMRSAWDAVVMYVRTLEAAEIAA
jgi:hypothetical protein